MPSARYSVAKGEQEGFLVCVLRDQEAGCEAKIAPQLGNSCFSFQFDVNGEHVDVLEPIPCLAALEERPSGYAVPILFPFPNRIRGGRFSFEGRNYQFDVPEPKANSIHGLVLDRPWKVEKAEATDEDGACLVSSIKAADFPDIIRQYPFPFNLRVTYTLRDGVLSLVADTENLGQRNMPMGFGIHPYFRFPLSESSSPQDCQIKVPVGRYWELEDLLPTGNILDASEKYDLKDGVSAADKKFDDVFTDVVVAGEVSRCVVDDKKARMRTIVESDPIFREIVVYNPPGRSAVCFEPYTCPTDAINLHQRGMDVGIIVLKPGESTSMSVKVVLERY